MGKSLIIIGILIIVAGIVIQYMPSLISWFGHLPGDIHIKSDNGSVFIPITSMIILSVVITIIINVLRHL